MKKYTRTASNGLILSIACSFSGTHLGAGEVSGGTLPIKTSETQAESSGAARKNSKWLKISDVKQALSEIDGESDFKDAVWKKLHDGGKLVLETQEDVLSIRSKTMGKAIKTDQLGNDADVFIKDLEVVVENKNKIEENKRIEEARKIEEAKKIEQEKKELSKLPYFQYLHGGVSLLSPYDYNPSGAGQLNSDGTKVSGYIEYVFSSRLAWCPASLDSYEKKLKRHEEERKSDPSKWEWFLPTWYPDFDIKMNINFGDNQTNANAIMGSGDFGFEGAIGLPVIIDMNKNYAWTLGPEVSYSVITQKANFEALDRWFFGLCFTLSCKAPTSDVNRILLKTRAGVAYVDALEFRKEDTREIKRSFGDKPQYSLQDAYAVETELLYPIGDSSNLIFGMKFYNGIKPNSWTGYIGYTFDIDRVVKSLFPNGNGQSPWAK